MLVRCLGAITIVVAGLNLITFGIWANGGNHHANPIWKLFASFLSFEVFVLRATLAGGLIWALFSLISNQRHERARVLELTKSEVPRVDPTAAVLEISPSIRVQDPIAPTPLPTPQQAPSTEDLKQKAINQILRGY